MKLAHELLGDLRNAEVIADRAYDAASLVDLLGRNGCTVVIPPNRTRAGLRPYDQDLYGARCLVEHFFQRIKRLRRIAMRFEKLALNFLSFLHIASVLVWLR